MTRVGMIVDLTRCVGCYNCQIACKDEYVGNDFLPYSLAQPDLGQRWMNVKERERGQYPRVKVAYIPTLCQHCDDAPCIKKSEEIAPGAIYRRPDGIVIIDPVKAAGRKELVDSCPYGVIEWNEERQLPQKCTMCAHLSDKGWSVPRCVSACPVGALIFGDLDDPHSKVSKLIASGKTETLHQEWGIDTAVRYISLPKAFIAGSVIFADSDECAEGVNVTLTEQESGEMRNTKTNNYGDFEFEGLETKKSFVLTLQYPQHAPKTSHVSLETDTSLGEIKLSKR